MASQDDDTAETAAPSGAGGAPAAAGGGLQVSLGPPVNTVTTRSPTSSTTRVQSTPAYRQDVDAIAAAGRQQAMGLQQDYDTQIAQAQHAADLAPVRAAADDAYLAERQRLAAQRQADIMAARALRDRRVEEASRDPTGFWDDKSEGQKMMARIGIWISAFGAGFTGRDNKAMTYINDAIKQDTARKQARAERLMKLAESSQGALRDAYQERAADLADLDAQHLAGLQIAKNQAELYAQTMLPDQLKGQAQQKIGELGAAIAQKKSEMDAKLLASTTSHSGSTERVEALNPAKQPQMLHGPKGEELGTVAAAIAPKLEQEIAHQQEYVSALDDYIALQEQAGPLDRAGIPTEKARQLEQAKGRVRAAAPAALGLPPRLGPEQQKLVGQVAPSGSLIHSPVAELKKARADAQQRLQTSFALAGAAGRAPQVGQAEPTTQAPSGSMTPRQAAALAKQILSNPGKHTPEDVAAARRVAAHLREQLQGTP